MSTQAWCDHGVAYDAYCAACDLEMPEGSTAPSAECSNRPEWAMPGVPAISPEGFCFHCSKVRGKWIKCESEPTS